MVTRFKARFLEAIKPRPKIHIRSLSLTDALIAAEWLNVAGTAERKRVLQIRDELEQLREILNTLHQQSQESRARRKGRRTPPSDDEMKDALRYSELHKQLRERHNNLNETLSHYSFCPVMACDPPSPVWRYNAVPKTTRGRQIEVTHEGITVQVNEAAVIAALARLAANGELHKLRLCAQCQEHWRVSEREIDRFCSDDCREESYKGRPEVKDRRQKSQKAWREREKKKDAAALAGVQRSPTLAKTLATTGKKRG
jgi:hypothetical protein